MRRKFKQAGEWLAWIVTGLLVLIMVFVLWGNKNGWQFAAVLSGSMEPVYHVGGVVVIRPVDVSTLKIGDPISFLLSGNNTPICHRIVDIQYQGTQEYFQTKGDANNAPDTRLVPLDSVKGEAIFHIPYIGRLAEIKKIGTDKITLLGKQLPIAVVAIGCTGFLFIGLMLKDVIEDIFLPGRRWQRESIKKRNARYALRRKAFHL